MKIKQLHTLFLKTGVVSTDTRNIQNGALFFALKGENFDGNQFAKQALDSGASIAVIDDPACFIDDTKIILVEDTLAALQRLAAYHRKQLNTPIVALTGSNGKTTSKELINSVLSKQYETVATKGNLNNHIGVPLTLLNLKTSTEIAIVEMGANHHGEITQLCEIAQPDYGYITNFGKAHLEGFGSLEGVVKAKTELYRHLAKNDKIIFVNIDDPKQVAEAKEGNIFSFGSSNDANVQVKFVKAAPFVEIVFENIKVCSKLIGAYNFNNIAAAIAIGKYFNVPDSKIRQGIENYQPENNRSQILKKGTNTLLMDAYNANPTSMLAAIENMVQLPKQQKILILGDMFEVGEQTAQEHQEIVNAIEKQDFQKVFLIGNHFKNTTSEMKYMYKFKNFAEFQENFEMPNNSFILVKGSRGMQLERILDLF
ncbi:MAG TPA: UDP-N-acetylmuramoyl-tripeptide--D-alanyl-D-alanine ligase [Flavobacteriaceae bacterium]|nr:UDP-N-acetylmuramoyl-tripeptide--D-alanyl-D-alanine ligase [Flavobacteriaceae bacterium]